MGTQHPTQSEKPRQVRPWMNWASVALAVLVAAVTLRRPEWMRAGFSYLTYYLLWLLIGCSVVAFVRRVREHHPHLNDLWRTSRAGVGLAALITILVVVSTPVRFRVLSDETNFVGVSRALLYEHRADFVTEGRWYYGNFWPLERAHDQRPALFPFTVHLAHLVAGYRPANAFVVNGLALWVLLMLVYVVVRRALGAAWAGAALLLVVAQPLVCLCATSGGVELLNTVLLGLSAAYLHRFLKDPCASTFRMLWCCLLLLAHVRQESVLIAGVTVVCLIAVRVVRWEWMTSSIIYPLTPWIMLPLLWQRVLMPVDPDWPPQAFGVGYLWNNGLTLLKSLFDGRLVLPYASLVNGLGVMALLRFLTRRLRQKSTSGMRAPASRWTAPIILVSVGLFLVIGLTYYLGDADHPAMVRLFLPLVVILSTCSVFALQWCVQRARHPALLGVLLAGGLFALYHPIASEDRFTNQLFLT